MANFVEMGFKWGNAQLGTAGGKVTWSFAGSAGDFFGFDKVISQPEYQALIRAAFDAWEAVANIDFVEVADSASSNIRLGWDSIDGPNNYLGEAYTTWKSGAYNTAKHSEIRFDTAEVFSINKSVQSSANFFALALHEIGHAIGLDHTTDIDTVMYPIIGHTVKLSAGEIAGAQALYGPSASYNTSAKAGMTLTHDQNSDAAQAYRLYQAAFDRTPDTGGLNYWIDQREGGMALDIIAGNFIASKEFQNLYGDQPTDAVFIDLLYHNVMDRAPDQAGFNFWMDKMEDGMSQADVLVNFSESAENKANVAHVFDDGLWYS